MASSTPEQHKLAAALLGSGKGVQETADEIGVDRVTIWRWRQDPEFQALVDAVTEVGVIEARQRLRNLADATVSAFERGLKSRQSARPMKLARTEYDEEGRPTVRTEEIVVAFAPDDSLAVHTADLVARRIPELAPSQNVIVSGGLEARLSELDRAGDSASD